MNDQTLFRTLAKINDQEQQNIDLRAEIKRKEEALARFRDMNLKFEKMLQNRFNLNSTVILGDKVDDEYKLKEL